VGKARTEKEKSIDKRIKEELTRYYEYRESIPRLKARKKRCEDQYKYELNNPPYGGSIAKVPENSNVKDNTITMKWSNIISNIENDIIRCESQVHKINKWLTVLTPDQYRVIKKYVCEYKCQNRPRAAAELKCSEDNVKDRMNDGIRRIRKNFDNII